MAQLQTAPTMREEQVETAQLQTAPTKHGERKGLHILIIHDNHAGSLESGKPERILSFHDSDSWDDRIGT